jgi:hypothetical protein
MSVKEKCKAGVRDAYGQEMSDVEIEDFVNDIELRAKSIRAKDAGLSMTEALEKAADEFSNAAEIKAIAQKRNTMLNARREIEAYDYIRSQFQANPKKGLKTILVGTQGGEVGSRHNVGGEQWALHNYYVAGLDADLKKITGGNLRQINSGELDDSIAEALWRLNKDKADLSDLPPQAAEIAKAFRKWQELSRKDGNKAGAFTGKLDNYIMRQSHDPINITKNKAGWEAKARESWDWERMGYYTQKDIDAAIPKFYQNLSTGIHLKSGQQVAAAKGLKGMARGLSQERVIHFKDSKSFMDYNREFGFGSMIETVYNGLERSARATGMMRVLGPNHELVYDNLVKRVLKDLQENGGDATGFETSAKRYKDVYMKEMDGSLDVPGSNTHAQRVSSLMAIQNMASLANSVFASVGDLGTMALGAKFNQFNPLAVVANGLKEFASTLPTTERLEIMADLGMAFEALHTQITKDRFSVDTDVRGKIGWAQQKFWTFNLQNRWTDRMRYAISTMLSSNLARKASMSMDELHPELKRTLGQYGIDAGKWDIIRSGTLRESEGNNFLTPSALDEIDDAVFKKYLDDKGVRSSKNAVTELREDMKRELRGYFVDQSGYMLLTPDAGTRGIVKQGTQVGTPVGSAVRLLMQFKSYSIAFSQKVAGREIQQGGLQGVARMIAFTTIAGYAAMTLKDLSKGKTLRDPREDPGKTMTAAMMQGGGLGIYGDVLFSQVLDRRGADAGWQLLGPTASDVFSSQGILATTGKVVKGEDAGASTLRLVQSNTPFINQFMLKQALDYAIFYELQEMANPGSLKRMEKRIEEDTGQTFMIPPSETVQ